MFMAGIVSASWLRLIPLRDLDFRLFGTATTQISEFACRFRRDFTCPPDFRQASRQDIILPSCGGTHEMNEKENHTPRRFAKQEIIPIFLSSLRSLSCDRRFDRLI
jgi:hypothetical protein